MPPRKKAPEAPTKWSGLTSWCMYFNDHENCQGVFPTGECSCQCHGQNKE